MSEEEAAEEALLASMPESVTLEWLEAHRHDLDEVQRPIDCPVRPDAAPPSAAEVDAVVSAALLHFVQHPGAWCDGGILPANKLVRVRREIGEDVLSSRALPDQDVRDLDLRPTKDIQWEADRMDSSIPFLSITDVAIEGDCATIRLGPAIMPPSRSIRISLCCCSEVERYERQSGRWQYRVGRRGVCS